jgi:hypothetical protein
MDRAFPTVVEAFSKDEIGLGHALLLARLQPAQQEEALNACFREELMGADQKPKRIPLPVRQLQVWIDRNVLLILKDAPLDRKRPLSPSGRVADSGWNLLSWSRTQVECIGR